MTSILTSCLPESADNMDRGKYDIRRKGNF